jgi:hypothetical protein
VGAYEDIKSNNIRGSDFFGALITNLLNLMQKPRWQLQFLQDNLIWLLVTFVKGRNSSIVIIKLVTRAFIYTVDPLNFSLFCSFDDPKREEHKDTKIWQIYDHFIKT